MKNYILLALAASTLSISCSKNKKDFGKDFYNTIESVDRTSSDGSTLKTTFEYDAQGRIISTTQSFAQNGTSGTETFSYAYDGKTVTRTAGTTVTKASTDPDGRIISIVTALPDVTVTDNFSYDVSGRITGQKGGTEVSVSWDDYNMLSNTMTLPGGIGVQSKSYTYGSEVNNCNIDMVTLLGEGLLSTNGWLGFNFGKVSRNVPVKISDGISAKTYDYTADRNGRIETITEYSGSDVQTKYVINYKQ